MASKHVDAGLLILALVLASCTQPPAAEKDVVTEVRTPTGEDRAAGPRAATARPVTSGDLAAAVPVPFGSSAIELRRVWKGDFMAVAEPESEEACYYLLAQPSPQQGYGRAFMFEGARLVRMDVDDPASQAPGGARVGMELAQLQRLYAGRMEVRPHKYVEAGHYLRVRPAASGPVLVMETDARGKLHEWRVGIPPQVDYVEGCS